MSRDLALPVVWALVPVKDPARAKTRLAPVLSADQRAALQRAMLADVLAALGRARTLAGIAVIALTGLLLHTVQLNISSRQCGYRVAQNLQQFLG